MQLALAIPTDLFGSMPPRRLLGLGATAGSFICEGLLPLSPAFLKDRLRPIWRRMTKRAGRGAFWLSPKTRGLIAARRSKHESAKGRNVRTRGQVQLLRNANYGFDAFMREQCEQLCASTRLELRHPYYSAKFIEFALATPERLRKQGRISKYIHTEALKGVLPEIIRTRTTKADFESVFALRLKVMEDFFTTDLVEARSDWLDRDGMRQLFQAYIDSPQDGWQSWILWGAFASHVSLR